MAESQSLVSWTDCSERRWPCSVCGAVICAPGVDCVYCRAWALKTGEYLAGVAARRVRIYLVSDRAKIHGRPMEVYRTDAREWIEAGLARDEPFAEAAAGELVTAKEYREPGPPYPPGAKIHRDPWEKPL